MSLESEFAWLGKGESVYTNPAGPGRPIPWNPVTQRVDLSTKTTQMRPGVEVLTREEAQGGAKPLPSIIMPSSEPENAIPPYQLYAGVLLAIGLIYIGYNYYRKGAMW